MSSKEPAGHLADDEHLSVLGYEGKFDRSIQIRQCLFINARQCAG